MQPLWHIIIIVTQVEMDREIACMENKIWNLGISFLGNCAFGGKYFQILRGNWIFLYFSYKKLRKFVFKIQILTVFPGYFSFFPQYREGVLENGCLINGTKYSIIVLVKLDGKWIKKQ